MSIGSRQGVFEVALKVTSSGAGNIDILKRLLNGIGIDEERMIECEEWPERRLSMYFDSQAEARALQQKLRNFRLHHVSVAMKRLLKKDWQTKWKKELQPFALTETLGVVPTWLRKTHSLRGRKPIYIDTGLAFGTGMHATTRFMAQFIEQNRGRFRSFLDIGTGTGILAVVASRCGAQNITAIDICPEAVSVARSNIIENKCPSIHVRTADAQKVKIKIQYDFVCANIITQDLIRMAAKIIGFVKPGKYLAVSGISLKSYDVFRRAYARYPLRCLKIEKGDGWTAILYKKNLRNRAG